MNSKKLKLQDNAVKEPMKNKSPSSSTCGPQEAKKTNAQIKAKQTYALMEKAVFLWYSEQRNIGHPVSSTMLRAKAVEFNAILGGPPEFRASDVWFNKFKTSHDIICNTKENGSLTKTYTPESMQGFDLCHIYNADETVLTWKSLPAGILLQVEGLSQIDFEDHVTLLSCSNVLGTNKIPLFLIVNTEHMAYFTKEINFPVICRSNDEAWMTEELFDYWFRKVFVPTTTKKTKNRIMLIVDCMRAHRTKEYLNSINDQITVEFIPPNLTLDVQPMALGISKSLKSIYRKLLLLELKQHINSMDSVVNFFDNWSILNCYRLISIAWESVPESTIVNAWCRILDFETYCDEDENNVENIMSLLVDIFKFKKVLESDVVRWIQEDDNLPCCSVLSDDEILRNCFRERNMTRGSTADDLSSPENINEGSAKTIGDIAKVHDEPMDLFCNENFSENVQGIAVTVGEKSQVERPASKSPEKAVSKSKESSELIPSKSEALAGLSSFRKWYESRPERSEENCKLLEQLYSASKRIS